mgnify:CR=1 FL=1
MIGRTARYVEEKDALKYIAGYCPTGEDSLYAYIVEAAQDRSTLSKQQWLDIMIEESRAYHGPWDDIRPLITDPDQVNYTWFEYHVLDAPWNRSRVVLVGDAHFVARGDVVHRRAHRIARRAQFVAVGVRADGLAHAARRLRLPKRLQVLGVQPAPLAGSHA